MSFSSARGAVRPSRSRRRWTAWAETSTLSRRRSTRASTRTRSTALSGGPRLCSPKSCSSPTFNAGDVATERGVILEEIGEANDNPDDLAHETFVRSFWRATPSVLPSWERPGACATSGRRISTLLSRDVHARQPDCLRGGPSSGQVLRADRAPSGTDGLLAPGTSARGVEAAPAPHRGTTPCCDSRQKLAQAHLCLGMEAPAAASGRRFAAASWTSFSAPACPRGSSRKYGRREASPTRSRRR